MTSIPSTNRRRLLAGLAALPLAGHAANHKLRVGIRGGTGEEIWAEVARIAKAQGLDLQLVVLAGSVSLNEALNNGDLDANAFQHVPFLKDEVRQRGYQVVPVGNTLFAPLAFYSRRHRSLKDLPERARIGVPNDPSNQTRALALLQEHGVVRLRDGLDPRAQTALLADIVANPRKVEIVESATNVLARALPDLDAAAIINTFSYQVGLIATRDGIAVERLENNPYVNVIAVRSADRQAPWVRPLLASFQNDTIRQYILSQYQGSLVPAF
ncbi:MetQ/NlpA family ABC transporter substrate-binding protein [Comamonas humi]